MRKFGIVLIAACASFFCANGVQAQSKVTKKAKTAKVEKAKKPKGKKAGAAVAKVDTVPVSDFSYCMYGSERRLEALSCIASQC